MKNQIRLRFAPSPTGPLHIGGLRTALFNYLFAKKMGGELVLRIEDTDKKRTVKKSQKHIEESLSWLGIDFDESASKGGNYGPYNQSERGSIYIKYANELIEKGLAYYAFDTTEALELERKGHEKKGKTFIYNSHNREKGRLVNSLVLSEKETQEKIIDLIIAEYNNAKDNLKKKSNEEISKITGGINLPMDFKLPF